MGQIEEMASLIKQLHTEVIQMRKDMRTLLTPPKEWLSETEAQQLLGKGRQTLYRLAEQMKAIRKRKVGRANEYLRQDIEAYKENSSYRYFLNQND